MPHWIFVWTIGDAVTAIVILLALLAWLCIWVPSALKEALCKHDGGVSETRSWDAICDQCGKNLGFIGTWQKEQSQRSDHK